MDLGMRWVVRCMISGWHGQQHKCNETIESMSSRDNWYGCSKDNNWMVNSVACYSATIYPYCNYGWLWEEDGETINCHTISQWASMTGLGFGIRKIIDGCP